MLGKSPMSPICSTKILLRRIVAACLVLGSLILIGHLYFQYTDYHNGIAASKEWARLDEFPSSAKIIDVVKLGNVFTRGTEVTFTAPLDDIDRWLKHSPGTAGVLPTQSGTIRHYAIEAGGGAVFAELEVNIATQTVRIYAYWS